jgi:hypothetical protein
MNIVAINKAASGSRIDNLDATAVDYSATVLTLPLFNG